MKAINLSRRFRAVKRLAERLEIGYRFLDSEVIQALMELVELLGCESVIPVLFGRFHGVSQTLAESLDKNARISTKGEKLLLSDGYWWAILELNQLPLPCESSPVVVRKN